MTRNTQAPTKPQEPRSDSTPYPDMGENPGPQTIEQYEKTHGLHMEYGCPNGDKHEWDGIAAGAFIETGQCERKCRLCGQYQHTRRYYDGIWLDGPMLPPQQFYS